MVLFCAVPLRHHYGKIFGGLTAAALLASSHCDHDRTPVPPSRTSTELKQDSGVLELAQVPGAEKKNLHRFEAVPRNALPGMRFGFEPIPDPVEELKFPITKTETKTEFLDNLKTEFDLALATAKKSPIATQHINTELERLLTEILLEAKQQSLEDLNLRIAEFNSLIDQAKNFPEAPNNETNRLTGELDWIEERGRFYLAFFPPKPPLKDLEVY